MALISCPECGKENVSDSAEACPNCGYGIREHFEKIKQAEAEKERKKKKKNKQYNRNGKKRKCNGEKLRGRGIFMKKENG